MIDTTYTSDQLLALEALDVINPVEQVLFGGAAGGGKSWFGCDWQIKRRLKYPGTVGLLGRAELKKLQLSTMQTFWRRASELNLKNKIHYSMDGQYHIIKFFNGSKIFLMDMAFSPGDPDFTNFGSIELTDYFIDEVAEVSKKGMDILDGRVRYKMPNGRPKGLMSCNPSKGWLYNEYYEPHTRGSLPMHRAFIPALGRNNPHLPQVYLDKLARLPEEDRKRLLDGDWDYDDSQDILFQYFDLIAMFRPDMAGSGEWFMTVDVARLGKDTTRIGIWHGMRLIKIVTLIKQRTTEVEKVIRELINEYKIRLTNIIADEDGIGGGVVDHIHCRGFLNGGRAEDPEKYPNMKSQCYYKLAEMVEQNLITVVPELPEKNELIKQLDMIRRKHMDSEGKKLTVTSKDELQKIHGISPDIADMLMMRMFFELMPNYGKYASVRR